MKLDESIKEFLDSSIKDSVNKSRDIELILFFYGFTGHPWPTLEDAATEFNIGNAKNPRERVRQIIKDKFRKRATTDAIPPILECAELIKNVEFVGVQEIHSDLVARKLIPMEASLRGLLNLLVDLNLCNEYEVYTAELKVAKRSSYNKSLNLFLVKESVLRSIEINLNIALQFPNRVGIAKVSKLRDKLLGNQYFEHLMSLLKSNESLRYYQLNNDEFYIVEGREDNTLLNSLEKIKNVANYVDVDELAGALENSFKKRTVPNGNEYPEKLIIKEYLIDSRYTSKFGRKIRLDIQPSMLNPIESDIVSFLKNKSATDFSTISDFLKSKQYSKPNIDKTILSSPLIVVEKPKRMSYSYRLIGSTLPANTQLDRYQIFRNKLEEIGADGTDKDQNTRSRKEHHVLTAWLFENIEYEDCAICGHCFSVRSLTTAHKKRRVDCAPNERLDPHIVMPACNFGCDYLYEKGIVWIENGIIKTDTFQANLSEREKEIVGSLENRKVDDRWLEGNDSYFDKAKKI